MVGALPHRGALVAARSTIGGAGGPPAAVAGDLVLDGGASVVSAEFVDGRTVRFTVDVPDAAGGYSYSLAADGVEKVTPSSNQPPTKPRNMRKPAKRVNQGYTFSP